LKGEDGKDGIALNGKDGTIGINGKDGSNGMLKVKQVLMVTMVKTVKLRPVSFTKNQMVIKKKWQHLTMA